jgi:DNA-binding NtrC family response regulator/tetratricopeptide (TPR) repeat protein
MKIVECLLKRSRCTEALSKCRTLDVELAGQTDRELSARLKILLSHAYWKLGEYTRGIDACEEARRLFAGEGNENGLAQCHSLFGKNYLRLGQFEKAKLHFEEALATYLRLNDKSGIAVSHNNLALLHKNHGEWQLACDHLVKALELDKEGGNYGKIALRRLNLGLVYLKTGQWMKARDSVEEALSIAQRIGDQHTIAAASIALGNCMRFLGQQGAADRLYGRAIEIAEREKLMRELALAYEFSGESKISSGDPKKALESLAQAMQIAQQIAPEGDIVAEVERRNAEAYLALGDLKSARRAVRRSIRLCRQVGDRYEEGAALCDFARVKAGAGCAASAGVAFEASAGILEAVGDRYGLARTLLHFGRFLRSVGYSEKEKLASRRILARAVGLFTELGLEELLLETERELETAWSDGNGGQTSCVIDGGIEPRAGGPGSGGAVCRDVGANVPAAISTSSRAGRELLGSATPTNGFVTRDARLIEVIRAAQLLRTADTPVLIQGETGTGKNLLAYIFRSYDEERGRPFVELNCAAIPAELLESELFGYSKGAFSGANSDKKGILEEAQGGSVFLNEIGEMDARMQAKLLHVLDDGWYRRVGETTMRRLNARIISATNKELWKEVQRGTFRRDLYFRLTQSTLTITPLRERQDDIAGLCEHFFRFYSKLYSKEVNAGARAMQLLCEYSWPGNVRELRNKVQMLVLDSATKRTLAARDIEKVLGALLEPNEPATLSGKIEQLKRAEISRVLAGCGGNKTKAARALGMSRRGLCKVVERMQLRS